LIYEVPCLGGILYLIYIYIYKQTNQRMAEATFVQIGWEVPKPPQKIDKT